MKANDTYVSVLRRFNDERFAPNPKTLCMTVRAASPSESFTQLFRLVLKPRC